MCSLVFDCYWAAQNEASLQADVRKRLQAIRKIALELRDLVYGSSKYHRRRRFAKSVFHEQFVNFSDMESFIRATADVARDAQQNKNEAMLLGTVEGILSRKAGIDVFGFGKTLEKISRPALMFKSKGGRPINVAMSILRSDLATAFERWTGKRPSVTEGPYKKERYSGDFVEFVAIVDRDVAEGQGKEAKKNSALGPALRRQTRRVNKTSTK